MTHIYNNRPIDITQEGLIGIRLKKNLSVGFFSEVKLSYILCRSFYGSPFQIAWLKMFKVFRDVYLHVRGLVK